MQYTFNSNYVTPSHSIRELATLEFFSSYFETYTLVKYDQNLLKHPIYISKDLLRRGDKCQRRWYSIYSFISDRTQEYMYLTYIKSENHTRPIRFWFSLLNGHYIIVRKFSFVNIISAASFLHSLAQKTSFPTRKLILKTTV